MKTDYTDLKRAFIPVTADLQAGIEDAFERGEREMKKRHKIMSLLSIAAVLALVFGVAGLAANEMYTPKGDNVVLSAGETALVPTAAQIPEARENPEEWNGESAGHRVEEAMGGLAVETAAADTEEVFAQYAAYGLRYDAEKDELYYNEKLVRWFEDYYPAGSDGVSGVDFWNKDGVTDVRALRIYPDTEGESYEPAGTLVGLEEFDAGVLEDRQLGAVERNAVSEDAILHGEKGDTGAVHRADETAELDEAYFARIAEEYGEFGVRYDAEANQWYFEGEPVRYFWDVLSSNGEQVNGGSFQGSIRSFGSGVGTVDVRTIRDYARPDSEGIGTLIGIERCSQEEFDARGNNVSEKKNLAQSASLESGAVLNRVDESEREEPDVEYNIEAVSERIWNDALENYLTEAYTRYCEEKGTGVYAGVLYRTAGELLDIPMKYGEDEALWAQPIALCLQEEMGLDAEYIEERNLIEGITVSLGEKAAGPEAEEIAVELTEQNAAIEGAYLFAVPVETEVDYIE